MTTPRLYGPLPDGYHEYERPRLQAEFNRRQMYNDFAAGEARAFEELYPTRAKQDGPTCPRCDGFGYVQEDGVVTCWSCDGTGVQGARIVFAPGMAVSLATIAPAFAGYLGDRDE